MRFLRFVYENFEEMKRFDKFALLLVCFKEFSS